ncbi:phosphonate transport system permease protein [Enhydrobacter aerosaccus]|uniref:Phosphonate transport system permease protein n=2 Tax=Enhydrobacter aerosaccus TaxID=225324 RepID=A0A1T4SFZ5_9HYPH|nr:phosphonate transport system permease protein [Enhydrobacter aerosaccus]
MLLAALLVAIALSSVAAEVSPSLFWAKIGNFTGYFGRLLHLDSGALVFSDPVEWFWGIGRWLRLLGETLVMAYVGTVLGAIGAFFLAFLAAANVTPNRWLSMAVRRFCEFCRTVPGLVFALMFVIAFGLGPMAGVLAVAIHSLGTLGKLFSEVVENIDMKPVEGVSSTGAPWHVAMRFGALPQVSSSFVSYALLRFEINVRESAVLGFVGAGGIGMDLFEAIRKFYYSDVSAILVMIVVTVALIDILTGMIRHRLIDLVEKH